MLEMLIAATKKSRSIFGASKQFYSRVCPAGTVPGRKIYTKVILELIVLT